MFASIFGKAQPATERLQVTLDGKPYEICWRRRRNARKMTMRWRREMLQITTPHGVSAKMIDSFISDNRSWITAEKKRLDGLALIPSPPSPTAGGERPVIFFRGKPTHVRLLHNPSQQGRSKVRAEDGMLTIHLPAQTRLNPARVLENWMRAEARDAIDEELAAVLEELGENPVKISIRDQKSRWGSCSTSRRISFNWRLIMTPPLSLRYVVVHEAAHLHHHDHSPRFWNLVEKIMPDYRKHQQWLKQNQVALFKDISSRLEQLVPEDQHTHKP